MLTKIILLEFQLDYYKYRLYKNPDELYNYVTSLLVDKNNYYLELDNKVDILSDDYVMPTATYRGNFNIYFEPVFK